MDFESRDSCGRSRFGGAGLGPVHVGRYAGAGPRAVPDPVGDRSHERAEDAQTGDDGGRKSHLQPGFAGGHVEGELSRRRRAVGFGRRYQRHSDLQYVENCYYEGQLQASGPGGKYTAKIQLIYHELARYLVWVETDSRGFTVVKAGDILGMGGQLTWKWESMPFTYKGQQVRMAGTLFTAAPDQVLQNIMMSVDGVNQRLGNPKLEKVTTPAPTTAKPAPATAKPAPAAK